MLKYGLVLAGGGSLGAYEIGCIKRLLELDFRFDIITGTSIGSINGAMLALNCFDQLLKIWNNIEIANIIENGENLNLDIIKDFSLERVKRLLSTYGNIKGCDITPLKKLIEDNIDPCLFKNARTKIGIVVTDISKLITKEKRILLNECDPNLIIPYIHASCACYPIFPLVKIKNKFYIDGGYTNNFPIDYCFDLGAEKIIAINLPLPNIKISKLWLKNNPNVTYIYPTKKLGTMFDFSEQIVSRNITLGYLDTKKALGEIWGKDFYFEKKKEDEYLCTIFINALYKLDQKYLKKIIDDSNEEYSNPTAFQCVSLFLESGLKRTNENDLSLYSIDRCVRLLLTKLDEIDKDYYEYLILLDNIYKKSSIKLLCNQINHI